MRIVTQNPKGLWIKRELAIWIVVSILVGVLVACASAATEETTPGRTGPEETGSAMPTVAAGERLLNERCTRCHSLRRTTDAPRSRAEWEVTIGRMVNKGAELSPEEYSTLLDYLAENYGNRE